MRRKTVSTLFNSSSPGQNSGKVADDNFVNGNCLIPIILSSKSVLWDAVGEHSSIVQIMACCRTCHKPLLKQLVTQFSSDAYHDDVNKWKHFPRNWPFVLGIHRSSVNSPHEGQWRGALMFSLICAWINGWVNNREAGDLRRHHAHYDVTVMYAAPGGMSK